MALVSGAVILYAVLYLAHGVSLRTSSALLGTLASMLVAAILSYATIEMTRLTGLSEEQNTNVQTYIQHVSITGLLLAGFIIGSLGVLNDVTITQAASAFELASLDPDAPGVRSSVRRCASDAITSPAPSTRSSSRMPAGRCRCCCCSVWRGGRSRTVLLSDAVAIEIVRSAVGGIALALSVPLTTAIAVMLARPIGADPSGSAPAVKPSRGGRHSK